MADPTFGIHDYLVDYLVAHRPRILIRPLKRLVRWYQFLRRKRLPLTGWDYVFSDSDLKSCDVWLCFNGTNAVASEPLPRRFSGLKVFHVMDYSYRTAHAAGALKQAGVDYLLGYARHDAYCSYFRQQLADFRDRVIPWPFGFARRFGVRTPFGERIRKCSVMGAVVPMQAAVSAPPELRDYYGHFAAQPYSHPLRAAVREQLAALDDVVASYLPGTEAGRNTQYDSPTELNRYQLFLNDDSIMHYPPARTYEGAASGCVMVCSDHPCYQDFGWRADVNCVAHRWGDVADFARAARAAVNDPDRLLAIQRASLANAERFSHARLADGLDRLLHLLLAGKPGEAQDLWSGCAPDGSGRGLPR